MKTIFDFLRDILFDKSGVSMSNVDDESSYSPFMVNRWVSMYSPQLTVLINETSNRYWSLLSDKRDNYNFLLKILPMCPNRRIHYIKKVKTEPTEISEIVDILAKNMELSKREIIYYIDSGYIDLSKFKKS